MWLGVGEEFVFVYQNLFKAGQKDSFPENSFQFPCFQEEAFYIELLEQDELESDQAQISIDCKNLQIGANSIDLIVSDGDPL